jgi:phage terminase large subunit GpA-like protein
LPEPAYTDIRGILAEQLKFLLPPKRLSVDEYAAAHRWLPTGRWRHETVPYLVEPMRALTGHEHLTEVIVGPGQSGKTSVAENWFLYDVAADPADMLYYMQTDEGMEAFVKSRINTMIDAHEVMRGRLGTRNTDDSLHFKRFAGMCIEFLSATHSNLINKRAGRIVADEIDAWDQSFGDPKVLLDVRRQTYGRMSMLLAISHPDLADGLDPARNWRAGIMRLYADSDRRVWYWPCPQCGAWSSPVPTAARVMTLEYPHDAALDEIERTAHLKCPVNGCVIEDKHRRAMNLAGKWIGDGQAIAEDGTVTGALAPRDTAGFWIVGAMSPFLLKGIGGLARERAKAEKEFALGGDAKTLKEVIVKQWGFPFAAHGPVGSVDAETLAERARSETQPLDVVPEGVRFLTCWIDIQIAHFEVLVRGWGVDAESWVVAKSRVPADTATDRNAWYELLTGLINKRYPLITDPARGMAIRGLGYDSGGAPGVSDRAYDVWRRLKKENLTRLLGEASGRHVWTVLPTKGSGNPNGPRLSVVYPDNQKKDAKLGKTGNVPLALFNASAFKDDLAGQLMHADAGPGCVHIPAALRAPEPPHIVFEQLVSEKRDAGGRWSKPHQGVRNEMLDLMVGTHVLAHLHGLPRIEWKAPRAWCAQWDRNSLVGPLVETAATPNAKPKSIIDLLGPRR